MASVLPAAGCRGKGQTYRLRDQCPLVSEFAIRNKKREDSCHEDNKTDIGSVLKGISEMCHPRISLIGWSVTWPVSLPAELSSSELRDYPIKNRCTSKHKGGEGVNGGREEAEYGWNGIQKGTEESQA